jgi:hypothetical protein
MKSFSYGLWAKSSKKRRKKSSTKPERSIGKKTGGWSAPAAGDGCVCFWHKNSFLEGKGRFSEPDCLENRFVRNK